MAKFFGYILYFFISLMMNLLWSIPAWVLLVLHFFIDLSIWWFVGGLGLWILCTVFTMALTKFANTCSNEKDPPKENKNPYSKTK